MKKLTAMFLSLLMCFSLLAIPAQAAFTPDPDGSGIVQVGEQKGTVDPDEPGSPVQPTKLPEPMDEMPTD